MRQHQNAVPHSQTSELELSIVMPCLNEAETLVVCVNKANHFLRTNGVSGEVIVADNGSTDGSQSLAQGAGARVVNISQRGYGSAILGGIQAARGKFVVIGDADDSYDFSHLELFLEKLRSGDDLVMGNRFRGGIKPGAMPFLHRYLGNPVLTWVGRLFFKSPCGDFHCGLRGLKKESALRMGLRTTGMEFASEMVVKASLLNMRTGEVPTVLSPDGRSRPPHLRTWRDGWRHLRFLLLYSPRWLFLYPGVALASVSAAIMAWLLPGAQAIWGVNLDVHTLLYAAGGILVGMQVASLALFSETFAVTEGLLPTTKLASWLRETKLEKGMLLGLFILGAGLLGSISTVLTWRAAAYGALADSSVLRAVIPSVLCLALGCQIISSSFFLGLIQLGRTPNSFSETEA